MKQFVNVIGSFFIGILMAACGYPFIQTTPDGGFIIQNIIMNVCAIILWSFICINIIFGEID